MWRTKNEVNESNGIEAPLMIVEHCEEVDVELNQNVKNSSNCRRMRY